MANLVNNPGAETGSMSGWTYSSGNGISYETGWTACTGLPYNGTYGFCTTDTSMTSMSQALSLLIGNTYTVSIWVDTQGYSGDYLTLSMGGNTLISLTGIATNGYISYSYSFTAVSTAETLQISGYTVEYGLFVDSISVDGTANLVINPGAETGNMYGWQVLSSGLSYVKSSYAGMSPHTGSYFFYYGQDAITQYISLTVGDTYSVSFWARKIYNPNSQSPQNLIVNIGSVSLFVIQSVSTTYTYYSTSFTSQSMSGQLKFYSGNGGLAIDDVEVFLIPSPTVTPTCIPTSKPTTAHPTSNPTVVPTSPTVKPTAIPSSLPTTLPTDLPTLSPTIKPTCSPTFAPSVKPTSTPTSIPTVKPTIIPTFHPTIEPTAVPTQAPTFAPTTIHLDKLNSGISSKGFRIDGASENSQFGFSVSGGILSNNVYSTAIIGAPYSNASDYAGYVSTYLGKDNVAFSYVDQGSINFGFSVAYVGNFNNDANRFNSFIVGAPGTNNNTGSVYVYSNNHLILTIKGAISANSSIGDQTGYSVSGIGDFNGDEIPDIIIGAPYANEGYGVSYIIFGNKAYTSSSPSIIDLASLTTSKGIKLYGQSFKGNTTDSEESVPTTCSGWSVSGADLNNDGLADVVIGEPLYKNNQGRICITFGTKKPTNVNLITGLNVNCKLVGTSTDSQYSHVGSLYGFSVSIGDINNDGNNDIMIGAPEASTVSSTGEIIQSSGKTQIIYGSGNNAIKTLTAEDSPNGFNIYGNIPNSFSGWSVAVTDDVNGDEINDIIIGAPGFSNTSIGYTYVIYGIESASRKFVTLSSNFPTTIGFTCIGGIPGDGTGYSINGAGDINNDNLADIIIGAPRTATNAGAAYILYGFQQAAMETDNLALKQTHTKLSSSILSTLLPSISLTIGGKAKCLFQNLENLYKPTPYACPFTAVANNAILTITAPTSFNRGLYLDDIAVTFSNVPTNPGAENGMSRWNSTSIGWMTYKGYEHSGSFSFALSTPYNVNNRLEQAIPTILTPGASYSVTFYAIAINSESTSSISLSIAGAKNPNCPMFLNFKSSYTFTPYTCPFIASQTNIRLTFVASTSNKQGIYLDDIAISLVNVPTNPGAENGMDGWKDSSGWAAYNGYEHSGSFSFSLAPYKSNNYMRQTLTSLAPGVEHLVTFFAIRGSIPTAGNLINNGGCQQPEMGSWISGVNNNANNKNNNWGSITWGVSKDNGYNSPCAFVLNCRSENAEKGSMAQEISVEPNSIYDISFWAKSSSSNGNTIWLAFSGVEACYGKTLSNPVALTNLYSKITYTCNSLKVSGGRLFTIVGSAQPNTKIFTDDISVTQQSISSQSSYSLINTIENSFLEAGKKINSLRSQPLIPNSIETTADTIIPSIYIINGGKHYITSLNEYIIIDSPVNVTIVAKNSHNNIYTFLPQPNVYAKLTDFNVNDKIDLSVYEGLYDINQLKITNGNGAVNENVNIVEDYYSYYTYYAYYGEISGEADSAVITLDNGQTIELFNISPEDLTSDNFVFAQSPAPTMAPVYFTPASTGTSSSELSMEIIIGVTLGGVVLLSAVGYIVYAYFNNYCPFSLFKSVPSQDIADATVKITNQLDTEVITKQLEEGAAAQHTYETLQQQGLELTGIVMEEVL